MNPVLILNPPFYKHFSRPQRSPAVTKSGTIYFPLWLAQVTALLEREKIPVQLLDCPAQGISLSSLMLTAQELNPGLVVMDTSTPSIHNDLQVAKRIKTELPRTMIVLVGPHVSALPEETLQSAPHVDCIARREYDLTILELATHIKAQGTSGLSLKTLQNIPGISFRSQGQIRHNPDRPLLTDLDSLPWVSPIYKRFLDIKDYFNPNAPYPMVTLITSRGCPFRCCFCVYPQTLTGRKFRFRSIDDVLDEIEFIQQELPQARSIFFEDDTLTANKTRCLEFAEKILERGLQFTWTANSRIEPDLQTMRLLRRAGCRMLCVGFESGDPAILRQMKKGTTVDKMKQFAKDAQKAGIRIHGCFIFGFPGESEESIKKTIDFALSLPLDTAQFYPVMIYPGTEAYEQYKQAGWITAKDFADWLTPEGLHNCVTRNEYLGPQDLVRLCDLARRKFYLRPGYLKNRAVQSLRDPVELIRTLKAGRTFIKHLLLGSKV